jgi:hypothetical protein
MAKKDANPPSHILKLKSKDRKLKDGWKRVGAAWESGDGLIISLDKGIILDWHDCWFEGDFILALYPNDD